MRRREATVWTTAIGHTALAAFALVGMSASCVRSDDRPVADLTGSWEGTYVCPQGETAARLDLRAGPEASWRGTFTFGSMPGRTNARSGVFAVKAQFEAASRRLTVTADGWIERPPNYEEIDFTVTLDALGQSLAGAVDHPDCSSIILQRRMTS